MTLKILISLGTLAVNFRAQIVFINYWICKIKFSNNSFTHEILFEQKDDTKLCPIWKLFYKQNRLKKEIVLFVSFAVHN